MAEQQSRVATVCAECGAPIDFELGATHVACKQCGSGMAVSDRGLVRLSCPVCKGSVYFIDGALSGLCPYCDASLLALTRERVHRYVVRPAAPCPSPGAALNFFPFWRLAARLHGWNVGAASRSWSRASGSSGLVGAENRTASEVEKVPIAQIVERVVPDANALALGLVSLGIKSAVLPMEPLAPEHEELGRVVPVGTGVAEARETLYAAVIGEPVDEEIDLECQRVDVVAETLSLLYYPYWVVGHSGGYAAWDGVTGDQQQLVPTGAPSEGRSAEIFDDLSVVELSCGTCGEALAPGLSTAIFPCLRCGTFWSVGGDGSLEPHSGFYAKPHDGVPTLWLPFWRVSAELKLNGRRAGLAGELRDVVVTGHRRQSSVPTDPRAPLCYFVPAYGTRRAVALDAVGRDMTRLQPRLEAGPPGESHVVSCLYSPDDARRLGYVTFLGLVPHSTPRLLRSLRVTTGEVSLWYVPFERQGRELVNLVTGVRYDSSAITGVSL